MGANGCDAMRPLLAGYLYHDLPAEEAHRVETHLAACAGCRGALDDMRRASSALDAWVLPPKAVETARPTRRRHAVRKGPRLPLPAWAAAAAVFLLAVTLHLTMRPKADPAPETPVARPTVPPALTPAELAEREETRREAEREIARLEEARRRARERFEQIEREREKLAVEKPKEADLARIDEEQKVAEQELTRTREARREAETKLARAETKETVAVVAQLDWVQGDVFVLTPSGKVPARTSKALLSGYGLETGGTALAVVAFPDATRIEVGTATTVRSVTDGEIDLVRGTLRARVARPLLVRTPDAEARVLGTRLRLVSQESTRLEVQEGKVRLQRLRDKASVDVAAGTYVVTSAPRMIPRPIREAAFQDGTAPAPTYAGTRDTFLSELNAAHPYGTNSKIQVDGDNPGGTGKELRALVRWDVAAIPPGSRIQTATLVLCVSSPSEPPYVLHAMRRAWSETDATWQTLSGDRGAAVLGFAVPSGLDELAFPLNADGVLLVQSWIDAPGSNFGLVVSAPNNSHGMVAHSRDASEPGKRPKLVLTYTPREGR